MSEKEKIFTKGNLITMAISIVASVFIIILIAVFGSSSGLVNNNSFKIESFNMETESTDYTYTDNYTTYSGTGTVTCPDKMHNYYVLLQQTDKANGKTEQNIALVVNGTGEFTTYDSSLSDAEQKPDYEFKILGFIPFET